MYIYESIYILLFLIGIFVCIKGMKHSKYKSFFIIIIFYFILNLIVVSFRLLFSVYEAEFISFANRQGTTVGELVSYIVNLEFLLHVIAIICIIIACARLYGKREKMN